MTTPLAPLQAVASFNPAWTQQNLPGYTPVGYANEDSLNADALTFTAENALLGECAEDHLPFVDGDVLVPGTFAALRARHCMQARLGTNQHLGFCPDRMMVLRADGVRLDARYLLYFLRQHRMQALIEAHLQGSKRQFPHPREFLQTLLIPLPPLSTQQHWCRQLDHMFEQLHKWQETAHSRDTTRRLAFFNFFGSSNTMRERWPMVQLHQVIDKIIPGSSTLARFHASTGEALIRPCNLGNNRLHLLDVLHVQAPPHGVRRSRVEPGDVLFCMTGPELGNSAVAVHGLAPSYAGKGVAIVRSKLIEPGYLAAYLNSGMGMGEIEQALKTLPGEDFTPEALRALHLPLPPRPMQQEFMLADHEPEADCNDAWARLNQAQARFASLEQEAFCG